MSDKIPTFTVQQHYLNIVHIQSISAYVITATTMHIALPSPHI